MADGAPFHLHITQGAGKVETFFLYGEDGQRRTFTGYTARAQIRPRPGGTALLDLTPHITITHDVDDELDDGTTTTGQALVLSIPGNITRTLDRAGVWDLYLVHASDSIADEQMLHGNVTIHRAVTTLA